MKKITFFALALFGSLSMLQAQIASTSFEEPTVPGGQYTDTGDASVAHDLVNNAGEPEVDFTSTGGEIGFNATYVPYDIPGSGLTDGDFVGVTDFTGDVVAYTDGNNGYQMSDADGNMIVEFDVVDFNGFSNNVVFVDYFINATGWEGDGTANDSSNDRIRIYVRDLTNGTEIDILNTEGNDIDDLGIEDAWQNGSASVPDNVMVQLVVELRSNSGGEAIYLDNVRFEADPIIIADVEFDGGFVSVSEGDSSIEISVVPDQAPTEEGSVDVVLLSGGTAVNGTDFNYVSTETLMFPVSQSGAQTVTIPITNNTNDEGDKFFVLQLQNADNVTLGGNDTFGVYILDDDTEVPAGDDSQLDLTFLSSFLVDGDGTAEIAAYDKDSQQILVTNDTKLEFIDFSDPSNMSTNLSIDFAATGDGVQSVTTYGGLYALAISGIEKTDNGTVLIGDVANTDGVYLEVGALPDMVTFTPDGTKVIVANEGEPNDDYSIDPEGSISIIDVSGGLGNINQSNVTTLNFNAFDAQQADLEAAGVRIYGPGASVSQDLEPEYVAVSGNSEKAYVTLQENNAYAVVDLVTMEITDVLPFGLKDHSQFPNTIDVSDETDFVFDANWPIMGMYMPDAIATYEVDGTTYVVTANEGDAREYDTYEEERKIDDDDYTLDPAVFSNIDILELESNLAEINVTNASGDIDDDGLFEQIHVFGGRSFSIFEADSGNLVYDSANDFEVITANDPVYGGIFNASNSNNNFKNRSDNKGPEPEGVIVEEINGQYYAFVLLERIGGVMAYNVTDPANPVFLEYENSRDATPGGDEMGDLAPEGVVYIPFEDSPTSTGLLVLSNERSATLSVYAINNDVLSVNDFETATETLAIYPNPVNDIIFLSKPGEYQIYDITGRLMATTGEVATIDVASFASGTYIIKNKKGQTARFIVR
ncbi:choice-of-anchor I family protein [Aureisphaera galaxeae]|uniref:choice-of-anchor I family protein n=1 Tax=Aureisphaera galaxeae TaxID=1538023 RepID=UPI0023501972|nr:choice-of-anchor I family protein [Aureisphaera galaxeae]MDC8004882.1 choice-of-anchor I family protein [Aureisphaera galaxeae]